MKNIWAATLIIVFPMTVFAVDDPEILGEEAIRANPGLEAMRARSRELSELANVAGTWKDPMVGVEYLNAPVDSFAIDESPMSGIQFKIEQNLPELGWSQASRDVADLRVNVSEYETAESEFQLRRDVEVLFWKLTLSNLLEDVTEEHLLITRELLRSVRARYEVGKVGQNAILRLTVLSERLKDDLGDFEKAERALSAGLSRTLARPAESHFDTADEIFAVPVAGTASSWIETAKDKRPALARIREQVNVQRSSAELARISTRPDVNVWMKYRYRDVNTPIDDGTDFVSLGVSVPIPWGSRKKGLGEEAAHLQGERGARARLAATIDTIESDLISIDASWSRAFEKASTYHEELLPTARATLDSTLSDFSVGKADFASLYEAESELLDLEKTYLTAAIETLVQRAAARAAVGVDSLGEMQ